MKYKKHNELREFSKETACDGDLYLYQRGKLMFIGRTMQNPPHLSLFNRLMRFLLK